MDDFESLNSKTDADLAQIAVAFGDYTAEEVVNKTREDLIAAIMNGGAKLSKPEIAVIPDVKMEKATEAVAAEEKPAKKRTSRAKKTKEAKVETPLEVLAENASKEADKAPAEEKKKSSEKAKEKAPAKRGRKKKTEDAPVAEDQIPASAPSEVTEVSSAVTEAAAEAVSSASEEQNKTHRNEKIKSKRRKISFGPGQETKTQVVTSDAEAETNPEEEPVVELPQEIEIEGVLSIGNPDNGNKNDFCGFVHRRNYLPGEEDAYVSGQLIKRMGLRRGDYIKGFASPKRGKDRYAPLKRVVSVNGIEVDEANNFENVRRRPKFENLTAIYPDERLTLETEKEDISTRLIDIF